MRQKTLQDNYGQFQKAFQEVKRQAKRDDVGLVCVSKQFPQEDVEALIGLGQYAFGENRLQEMQEKFIPLKKKYPRLVLHFLGSIQSKKAKQVVELCDVIHTLDRPKLAKAIKEAMDITHKTPQLFIQVNLANESQKTGIAPDALCDFLDMCKNIYGLSVKGLMCLPPKDEPPSLYFSYLALLAKKVGLRHLSMGMSGDWQQAILFGATYIRVGQKIFGMRGNKPYA